ncbi:hypothetical protein BC829DRAFT_431458 [Chytridium lagenaria]|nr:hypothetical protein BC829DRAFT_431458 [Chytridium lagenaria]
MALERHAACVRIECDGTVAIGFSKSLLKTLFTLTSIQVAVVLRDMMGVVLEIRVLVPQWVRVAVTKNAQTPAIEAIKAVGRFEGFWDEAGVGEEMEGGMEEVRSLRAEMMFTGVLAGIDSVVGFDAVVKMDDLERGDSEGQCWNIVFFLKNKSGVPYVDKGASVIVSEAGDWARGDSEVADLILGYWRFVAVLHLQMVKKKYLEKRWVEKELWSVFHQ